MSKKRNIPECPVEMTLQLIGDKWKVLIIRDLLTGTKRFSELMRSVTGITQKVLTSNLRSMEADGLVNRKVYPQVPPKVEYSLTETGLSLKPILDSMVQWGTESSLLTKVICDTSSASSLRMEPPLRGTCHDGLRSLPALRAS